MGKKSCIFGKLFRIVREKSGRSQWDISVRARTHLSNVHQIETGHQEPRIIVAVRLVVACDANVNSFFSELAHEMNLDVSSDWKKSFVPEGVKEDIFFCSLRNERLRGYGELLRYCRVRKGLSQREVADKLHYDLRSLQRVEKGEQEPKITTAVKLVAAIDMAPGRFFEELGFFYQKLGEYHI